jgi:hypothetical protein
VVDIVLGWLYGIVTAIAMERLWPADSGSGAGSISARTSHAAR